MISNRGHFDEPAARLDSFYCIMGDTCMILLGVDRYVSENHYEEKLLYMMNGF